MSDLPIGPDRLRDEVLNLRKEPLNGRSAVTIIAPPDPVVLVRRPKLVFRDGVVSAFGWAIYHTPTRARDGVSSLAIEVPCR